MLYLFDIDGTLVDTGGAGIRALEETCIARFGDPGPPLDLAGSTDLGIVETVHAHFGMDASGENIAEFFAIYHERLGWNLAHGGFPGKVLPGVKSLLDELEARSQAVGLLTGNTAPGSAAKMLHFGLSGYFRIGAYGCDHADRNRLGPIALKRARECFGTDFSPAETIIIGDTPKDIACAKAVGARCLAVATGRFSCEELSFHGADHVVPTLESAAGWLGI